MKYRRILLGAIIAAVAGCSSNAVRVGPRPPDPYQVIGPAQGSACGVLLFDVIPLDTNSCVERAYGEAVASSRATTLIDTQVRDRWYFIGIGQLLCTDVQGTAISSVPQGGSQP